MPLTTIPASLNGNMTDKGPPHRHLGTCLSSTCVSLKMLVLLAYHDRTEERVALFRNWCLCLLPVAARGLAG